MGDGVPKQMPQVSARLTHGQGSMQAGIQSHCYRESYDMNEPLKAPLPYTGGKSSVAAAVWARLGDTSNYVEPFMGSAAVLLARPHDLEGKTETVNDLDGFLTCAYRSIAYAPEETAYWCDRPVNECDLTAFHLWLKAQRPDLTERLFADPFYFDPVVAGAFLWGAASWIGDGWCVADGPWINVEGRLVDRRAMGASGAGVPRQMPRMTAEQGIQVDGYRASVPRKMPEVGRSPNGQIDFNRKGVQAYRYQGVVKQMPSIGAGGTGGDGRFRGINAESYTAPSALLAYFDRLSTRLRRVRILCGDWRRVVKPSITVNHGLTAVFLDPPYPPAEHDMRYHGDNDVWHQAAAWAVEQGGNPKLRVAICGYWSEETDRLFPAAWERYRWQARGGYSNQKADGRGRENAARECIWFSPHCIDAATDYGPLFEEPAL